MTIKEELNKLKTNDIYSLILFVILQMKKLPEYSVLSELIYSVDKNSLLNLCKQFGGMTITIPTLDELNSIVNALLIFSLVNLDGSSFTDAINTLNISDSELDKAIEIYKNIGSVIANFDFRK